MTKLVLHSDQIKGKTELDRKSLNLFTTSNPKIAYIPSQSDFDRVYFNEKVAWYKNFGINDLFYFDVDKEFNENKIDELLSCDAIFLSGGDTYYFLNNLKQRKLIDKLREYTENGGILIGVSAGSIIMSETIDIATLHDENNTTLKDYSSLNLTDFDFFPHLNHNKEKYLEELIRYSKINSKIIYACNDGDGIIIENETKKFIGDVLKIQNGVITNAKNI